MDIAALLAASAGRATPHLVLDGAQLENNLRAAQADADGLGVAFHPHVKSHKSTWVARRQLDLGAAGLTCQTLGEAEVMVALDPPSLTIPVPLVGDVAVARLIRLAGRCRVATVVVDVLAARAIAHAAESAGVEIGVFVEVDTGYSRCGVSPAEVLPLASAVAYLPGLCLQGVLSYEGHVYGPLMERDRRADAAYELLTSIAATVQASGVRAPRISVGASAGRRRLRQYPAVTDVRWGSALLGDLTQVEMGAMSIDECALGVVASVIATPLRGGRAVLDAGSKALSYTPGLSGSGYGRAFTAGGQSYAIDRLADEQAMVDSAEHGLRLGERVIIVPTAHAACIAGFAEYAMVRNDHVDRIPIDARNFDPDPIVLEEAP